MQRMLAYQALPIVAFLTTTSMKGEEVAPLGAASAACADDDGAAAPAGAAAV